MASVNANSANWRLFGGGLVVGGFASAWFIFKGRAAKGTAGWILFVTAVFGLLYFAPTLGVTILTGSWIAIFIVVLLALSRFRGGRSQDLRRPRQFRRPCW
jgi:hypothetical protein